MDDRTLLEKAAMAAGITGVLRKDGMHLPNSTTIWNPLTDDGDALRLAVKLRLSMVMVDEYVEVYPSLTAVCSEFMNDDPYAATRLAIVRAAAVMADKGE